MVLCDLFDLTKGLLFDTFVITVWYNSVIESVSL